MAVTIIGCRFEVSDQPLNLIVFQACCGRSSDVVFYPLVLDSVFCILFVTVEKFVCSREVESGDSGEV